MFAIFFFTLTFFRQRDSSSPSQFPCHEDVVASFVSEDKPRVSPTYMLKALDKMNLHSIHVSWDRKGERERGGVMWKKQNGNNRGKIHRKASSRTYFIFVSCTFLPGRGRLLPTSDGEKRQERCLNIQGVKRLCPACLPSNFGYATYILCPRNCLTT